jgi:hypothetical protein
MTEKKKPVIAFIVYDEQNAPYAKVFKKSLRKFHSEEELPLYELTGEELAQELRDDPHFFYRQKPVIGERLIKEYEVVIGFDVDQIVLGDISYIWKTKDYDVAGVLNFNRIDAEKYGLIQGWGVLPIEYLNCGLVAMRNEKFVHDWLVWCFSPQFERLQYREQDGLNALVYHGNWNVRVLDHMDKLGGNNSWWGLIAKADWPRTKIVNNEVVLPRGEGDTPFPPADVTLKIVHFGEGANNPQKGNYRLYFPQDVVEYIDKLVI